MKPSPDVVVVGGGVVGAAVAYYLSVEGARVQVLERQALGSGCSFHGTGMAISNLRETQRKGPAFAINRASRLLLSDICGQLAEETGTDPVPGAGHASGGHERARAGAAQDGHGVGLPEGGAGPMA
ncbi:MAG: FAD-dependent oxidoreductase [Dehalococcoidia bacterium]|nr:FAD-dependent oxidoreductase [Dehalococcoidia bacterium]